MTMELEPFVFRHAGALVGMRALPETEAAADEAAIVPAVNRYALRPLRRDEYAVFSLDLCNNQIDKHFSRFPEEELEKIDRMTPGRPLMERHDLRGSLPRGTFFRSELHREEGCLSVRPDVYVLRTAENADFILNIEGGVYRETSIGFSFRMPECSICGKDIRTCDHVPGNSYGAQLCYFIMRDVLEVIEGSVVPAGSQGTGFVAQERALSLPEALEHGRKAYHEPIDLVGASGDDGEDRLTAACLAAVRDAMGVQGFTPEAVAQAVADGVEARRRAVERFCGLGRELDGFAFDEGVWRRTLEPLSLREIHGHLSAYEVRFDQRHPPQAVSRPESLEEEGPKGLSERAMAILRD